MAVAQHMSSSLLTSHERNAFHGFLSSTLSTDVLQWSELSPTQLPPAPPTDSERGALAKAARSLMSLEPQSPPSSAAGLNDNGTGNILVKLQTTTSATSMSNSHWPSFAPPDPPLNNHRTSESHSYTYGFGASQERSTTSSSRLSNLYEAGPSSHHHLNHLSIPLLHSHSESSLRTQHQGRQLSPSPFALPPISDYPQSQFTTHAPHHDHSHANRPHSISSASAPSVLLHRSSSSKRSLPPDANDDATSSKRRRESVSSFDSKPKAHSTSSVSPSSLQQYPDADSPSTASSSQQQGQPPRQALLSPSQKRANHIQSEQKRRANIRKGYEALCDVVPALREAIQLEDVSGRAGSVEDDKSFKGRGGGSKRRKKGKASSLGDDGDKSADGRAGPRSENVVLQKTIDHVTTLLSDRQALIQRLTFARSRLVHGHPALVISPTHLDERGVPLWEREWHGGTGWAEVQAGITGGDDGDGDDDC